MIQRIRIQNFRSLVDVTVELDELTVLIGRSGTGKSNFVCAVRFLRDCLNGRSANLNTLGGPGNVTHPSHPKRPLQFDVQLSIKGYDPALEYSLSVATDRVGQVLEESLSVGGEPLFRHGANKWVVPPNITPVPNPQGILLGAIPGLESLKLPMWPSAPASAVMTSPATCFTGTGRRATPRTGA